jgi:hypothetical protein
MLAGLTNANAQKRNNLSPAALKLNPTISSYRDPDVDFSRYKTFAVFPYSLLVSGGGAPNEILEKQILFFLRNSMEMRGYRFVQITDNPDLLVTMNVTSEYQQYYVPPQAVTVPQFVPGTIVRTQSTSSGNFNLNTVGSPNLAWGSYSGQTTSNTYVPGFTTYQTVTRPGYTAGAYYPSVSIAAFDGTTLKKVWTGTGVGTSDNPDARVSSQLVSLPILSQFPASTQATPIAEGIVGISWSVMTFDGNAFVPTVVALLNGGPAKKAGIKQYDMILAIDGQSLVNKPYSEVIRLLRKEPGQQSFFEVWRLGQRKTVRITRVARSAIKQKN